MSLIVPSQELKTLMLPMILQGGVLPLSAPASQKVTDFFGNALPGGAQVLPGFREESALTKTRNVWAGYGEFETDIYPMAIG